MLKVAVCDDEPSVIKQMTDYVAEYGQPCQIDTYTSGEILLEERKEYTVIFLDIDMKGMNGIQTAREIRKYDKKVHIIYVTAYEDYRNYAFSVHAFGYLVKPVRKKSVYLQLDEVLSYAKAEEPLRVVRFETDEGIEELDVKEICYFEYLSRRIRIVTMKRELWMRGSITELGKRMQEYGFSMPHKSFVVNLYQVKAIKGYDVWMMDGSLIPLSQKKSVAFREQHSRFLVEML